MLSNMDHNVMIKLMLQALGVFTDTCCYIVKSAWKYLISVFLQKDQLAKIAGILACRAFQTI